MNGLRVGVLVAAVVSGPPLWSLVRSGQLDADTALVRAGLVAAACAVAWSWIARLVRGYEADARRRRRRALLAQAGKALEEAGAAPARPPGPPDRP